MTAICEHFEEEMLSLSQRMSEAIIRRMNEESQENPPLVKEVKSKTIEEKLKILKELENNK